MAPAENMEGWRLVDVYAEIDDDDELGARLDVYAQYYEPEEEYEERIRIGYEKEKMRFLELEAARELHMLEQERMVREADIRTLKALARKYGMTLNDNDE